MRSYLLVFGSISVVWLIVFMRDNMAWSNLYLPIFFLAIGCGFIGIKNLQKLKVEIEQKFVDINQKTFDAIAGIYFAVYIMIFAVATPHLFHPTFFRLKNILRVIMGALFGIWVAGLSSPYYDYLTVCREKASILWKVPIVTLAMLWHGLLNITGPLENGRLLALFVFVSTLEFVIRILLRRYYIKIKRNKLLEK